MYIVRKYSQQIDRFISSNRCGTFSWAYGLLAVALAALAGIFLKLGAPAMNGRPWDTPMFLDAAWRIANGQAPHRDFYNYIGDLPLYLTYLGMKLSHPCVSAIDYGSVIFMVALVLPAMAILRRRTSAFLAFFFCLFVALMVVTPRPLGDPYDYTDHAMLYNRYGEACIAVLGASLLLRPRPEFTRRWASMAEDIFSGLLLVVLLGCKLNYFAVGLGFFGLALATKRLSMGRACLVGGSAIIFFAAALALTGIPFQALLADYKIMSACQSLGSKIRTLAIQVFKNVMFLPLLLALAWEEALGAKAEKTFGLWDSALMITGIFGAGVFLLASNTQIGEIPLLALAALFGVEMILRQGTPSGEEPVFATIRRVAAVAVALAFLLSAIAIDVKTVRFTVNAAAKKNWSTAEALASTPLSDFRFVTEGTRKSEMREYQESLDDGIQLLRRHATPGMRLNALLFSDPFHIALGLRPSSGGLICLAASGMTERSHPPLARLIGDASHLLTEPRGAELARIYGQDWSALGLKIVEQTKHYSLYELPETSRQTTGMTR